MPDEIFPKILIKYLVEIDKSPIESKFHEIFLHIIENFLIVLGFPRVKNTFLSEST